MDNIIDFLISDSQETDNGMRIRELTLKNGISYPNDAELIMLILGSGTKDVPIAELAQQVLGIVMRSNREELIENLMKIKGMGKTKALMIAAALEFGKRINRNPQASIKTTGDIIPYIRNFAMQKQEHFVCISLNGAMEIISIRVVCTGTGNMAIVKPSEVFEEPLKEHASAIIISHNHPSGIAQPSMQDVKITMRLCHAAEILGIALLDHIILGKNNYYSFQENELLSDEKLLEFLEEKRLESQNSSSRVS